MSDLEKPLVLRLLWGGADIRHTFSLQENETGDIVVSGKQRFLSRKFHVDDVKVVLLLIGCITGIYLAECKVRDREQNALPSMSHASHSPK